jgi:hypothetical protein
MHLRATQPHEGEAGIGFQKGSLRRRFLMTVFVSFKVANPHLE